MDNIDAQKGVKGRGNYNPGDVVHRHGIHGVDYKWPCPQLDTAFTESDQEIIGVRNAAVATAENVSDSQCQAQHGYPAYRRPQAPLRAR